MIREERNTLIAVVVAGVVTLGLGALSALWVDRVLGPLLRGTDWDWLFFFSALLLVGGHGWVWYCRPAPPWAGPAPFPTIPLRNRL